MKQILAAGYAYESNGSVYFDVVKYNEDYNIPAHEIRFIQECKNERAKKAMVDAMNRGDIRIIFGSTSMLGTSATFAQNLWAKKTPLILCKISGVLTFCPFHDVGYVLRCE